MDRLQTDLTTSLKAGKSTRVETIRFLIAGVRNSVTTKYGALWEKNMTDADVLEAVKKQINTHRESIEAFEKANRQELVDREKEQLTILEEFAPKELSDEELNKILEPIVKSGEKNFGLLMKNAMAAVAGRAEGGKGIGNAQISSMINVLFQTESHFPVDRKKVKKAIEDALVGQVHRDAEVSVSVVGNRQMKTLNKKYRNRDTTTDVLSFGLHEGDEFVNVADDVLRLGDIVVSYPQAVDEAREENKLVDDQIVFLVLHGLDHLLGKHHAE